MQRFHSLFSDFPVFSCEDQSEKFSCGYFLTVQSTSNVKQWLRFSHATETIEDISTEEHDELKQKQGRGANSDHFWVTRYRDLILPERWLNL